MVPFTHQGTGLASHSPLPARIDRQVCGMLCAQAVEKLILAVCGIVLMRLLSPVDMGMMGLGLLLVGLLNSVGIGIETAAVQLRTPRDRRMLFSASLVRLMVGIVLFLLIVTASDPVVRFFAHTVVPHAVLKRVTRIVAVLLVTEALCCYPRVLLQRQLRFGPLAVAQDLSAACYSICAVVLAWQGYAYWSLVYALLASQACLVFCLWTVACRERLAPRWDYHAVRRLFAYGRHVSSAAILAALTTKLGELMVSRWFGTAALGVYLTGSAWAKWTDLNVTNVVSRVLFPRYVQLSEEGERLRESVERALFYVYALVLPIIGVLALFVLDITHTLLGSQWRVISEPVKILSIAGMMGPFINLYGHALLASGRPELVQKYSKLHLMLFAGAVYPAAQIGGLFGVCWAAVLADLGVVVAVSQMGREVLGIQPHRAIRAIAAPLGSLIGAGGLAGLLRALCPVSNVSTLSLEVGCFLGMFIGILNVLTRGRVFREAHALLRPVAAPSVSGTVA